MDTPSSEDLIAARMDVNRVKEYLGVDTLGYLSCEGLVKVIADGEGSRDLCLACFDGNYRIPCHSVKGRGKGALERQ